MKFEQIKPERWQRIEQLYHAALECDANERESFLTAACAGDEALRGEIETLLRCDARAEHFIELPALEIAAQLRAEEKVQSMIGRKLDHYQILSLLGAGGMGEVYRARDSRLGREVAVKVLPAAFAADTDRLRRFEQEARAAGMLNHPNILTVHDIGAASPENGRAPYIVSELLEGETLRERMNSAAMPVRKAIDYAQQIARGLAAAHEKGIVHRDLKPENLFVTKDGRVKILDFGLAKLKPPQVGGAIDKEALTQRQLTDPGVVMGTVGYMAPEQVRGQEADHRADIFAFGAILYEMLTGRRAFQGETMAETMTAILKEEPHDITEINSKVQPQLERVVRHCLEKQPEDRFQSARDLGFDLESLSLVSGASKTSIPVEPATRQRRSWPLLAGIALALLAVVFVAGIFVGRPFWQTPPPSYQQLTFRLGAVNAARFTPDGQTIIYSAAWDGNRPQLFSTRPESPESRPLGLPEGNILAISATGEMAVSLTSAARADTTLARVPLSSGAPREVIENIEFADWSPDSASFAIVRRVGGYDRLEFPIGKVLYQTNGWIADPRVSPKGDQIAFIDHPIEDSSGMVAVVDLAGRRKTLSILYSALWGLAWSADGHEVWFTAAKSGINSSLYAATLAGRVRTLANMAGVMILHDISREGRVLIARASLRIGLRCLPPGETKERDLYWHDATGPVALSPDGKVLLFVEGGESIREDFETYLRKTDGSPAVRLGTGHGIALSPDGKWALSTTYGSPAQLMLLPTGTGEARPLTHDSIHHLHDPAGAGWFPDGQRIYFNGIEPGHSARCYVQAINGGMARPITQDGTLGFIITPDGKFITTIDPEQKISLFPIEGGAPRPIPGLAAGDRPVQWSADGRSLYVAQLGEQSAKVYRLDLSTRRKELWKELGPPDLTGVFRISHIVLTPDARSYAYSIWHARSELYLVEGLK